MPLVPGKVLAFRTFRVEWRFEHLTSSKTTPRDRAGNVFLVLPGIAGSGMSLPMAGTASRTISWKRKFFSTGSHCMYSTAFGCEPGNDGSSVRPIVKTDVERGLGNRIRGDEAMPVCRLSERVIRIQFCLYTSGKAFRNRAGV